MSGPISSWSGGPYWCSVEGALDEVVDAERAGDLPEHVGGAVGGVQVGSRRRVGAGPAGHGDRLLARRVRERVAERHQVEEVVGVQMADQHRVDVDVVADAAELREDAVAAVEQQREVALLDEVAAACAAGVHQDGDFPSTVIRTLPLSPPKLYPAGAGSKRRLTARQARGGELVPVPSVSPWREGSRIQPRRTATRTKAMNPPASGQNMGRNI